MYPQWILVLFECITNSQLSRDIVVVEGNLKLKLSLGTVVCLVTMECRELLLVKDSYAVSISI